MSATETMAYYGDASTMRSLALDVLNNEPSFKLAGIENYDANYWHLMARSLAEMVVALADSNTELSQP